jgi:hypothetical protein
LFFPFDGHAESRQTEAPAGIPAGLSVNHFDGRHTGIMIESIGV